MPGSSKGYISQNAKAEDASSAFTHGANGRGGLASVTKLTFSVTAGKNRRSLDQRAAVPAVGVDAKRSVVGGNCGVGAQPARV